MYIKCDYQIEQMKQFAKRQCKSYLYNLKFGDFCNRFVCFLHCTFWSGITLGSSCWDRHYYIIVLTTLSCLSNWLINKTTGSGMGFKFVKYGVIVAFTFFTHRQLCTTFRISFTGMRTTLLDTVKPFKLLTQQIFGRFLVSR